MKFRKKPVVIEAEQFLPDQNKWPAGVERKKPTIAELEAILNKDESVQIPPDGEMYWIDTLEGRALNVTPGDWIITGVKGEKYPCKPDIFEATYEPVE